MAMKAIAVPKPRDTLQQSVLPWLLGVCVAILAASAIIIGGWLAINGLTSLLAAVLSWTSSGVWRPLTATLFITLLALPIAALVGGLAAGALADERIFGAGVRAMRRWLTLLGSIPTIVIASAIVVVAGAIGWQPTLTGASLAVAIASMPLMTALAASVIGSSASPVGEAAIALGASPAVVVLRVLLPRAGLRFGGAITLGATNMIGGAAVVAIAAGALAQGSGGQDPIGAWPLAVQLWLHAPVVSQYGATAAGALVLTMLLWLVQGFGLLRATPTTSTESR